MLHRDDTFGINDAFIPYKIEKHGDRQFEPWPKAALNIGARGKKHEKKGERERNTRNGIGPKNRRLDGGI